MNSDCGILKNKSFGVEHPIDSLGCTHAICFWMNFSRSNSNHFVLDNLLQNRRKLKIEMLQNRSENPSFFDVEN